MLEKREEEKKKKCNEEEKYILSEALSFPRVYSTRLKTKLHK